MIAARKTYLWLILCLIAQAALMTHRLDLLPMWGDELFTLAAAQLPVGKMVDMVRGDVHPPLYFHRRRPQARDRPGQALDQPEQRRALARVHPLPEAPNWSTPSSTGRARHRSTSGANRS